MRRLFQGAYDTLINMTNRLLFTAAVTAAAIVPQVADAVSGQVSTIYSPTQNACLDVTTTSGYFLDIYGHTCDGATSQQFLFNAAPGQPANTYEIISRSTGECLIKYRLGIRQQACNANPNFPPYWTLLPTDTSGIHDQLAVLSSTGGGSDCVQPAATPPGYPGPLFDLTGCSTNPAQTLTFSGL